jgi:thioredoxin-related protein
MGKIVKGLKNVLIIFVLVSIGFALGKHSASKKSVQKYNTNKTSLVRVYYMHGTLRCTTCNSIQRMTEQLLEGKYLQEMADDKIEFVEVNFQENETLAKRFDVIASCVVVAKIKAGKIVAHQRLNKVWTLSQKPFEFNAYISKAIQAYLPPQGGTK